MRDLPDYNDIYHPHKISDTFWTPICSLQGKIYFTSVWDSSLFFENVILQLGELYHFAHCLTTNQKLIINNDLTPSWKFEEVVTIYCEFSLFGHNYVTVSENRAKC